MVVTAKSSKTPKKTKKKQHTYPKRFLVSDSGLKERKKKPAWATVTKVVNAVAQVRKNRLNTKQRVSDQRKNREMGR